MEHHSVERRVVIFFPKLFWPISVRKRANFDFFRNKFDIPHYALRFVTLTFILYEHIWIYLLIAYLALLASRDFRCTKLLRRRVSGESIWKHKFFWGQLLLRRTFLAHHPMYGIPMVVSQCIVMRNLHFFFNRKCSDFSTRFWPKFFPKKNISSSNYLHCLKF